MIVARLGRSGCFFEDICPVDLGSCTSSTDATPSTATTTSAEEVDEESTTTTADSISTTGHTSTTDPTSTTNPTSTTDRGIPGSDATTTTTDGYGSSDFTTSTTCPTEAQACAADASCEACLEAYLKEAEGCFDGLTSGLSCDVFEDAICCSIATGDDCENNSVFVAWLGT